MNGSRRIGSKTNVVVQKRDAACNRVLAWNEEKLMSSRYILTWIGLGG